MSEPSPVFEFYDVLSNRDLPLTSERQPRTMAIAYTVKLFIFLC